MPALANAQALKEFWQNFLGMVVCVEVGGVHHRHGATTTARLALEVNWRKFEVDNEVSLWGSNDPANRQWACRFCLLPDGTLSPVALRGPLGRVEIGPPVPKGLVLGIGAEGTNLILVRQDDTARRLLFRPVAEMTAQVGVLEQQQMAAASALLEHQRTPLSRARIGGYSRRRG